MKRNRKRVWRKAGRYWFCYLGHRKWWSPQIKGRIHYRKKDGSFFSPAPKNNGGLKGLKSWWKKRYSKRKSSSHNYLSKNYGGWRDETKKYQQKGRFDWLTYWRKRR